MHVPEIKNLKISQVTPNIWLVHQIETPFYFSCCDGLIILPKKDRNKKTVVIDLNIEPEYVIKISEIVGPISDYICSHGHLDHIAHVHAWENIGAKIHAPYPESENLLDLKNFYLIYGWNEDLEFNKIQKFANLNKYKTCKKVNSFTPGSLLEINGLKIQTIGFFGHSISHVGFLLKDNKVLHVSCLGFDKLEKSSNGFGPWYGFKQCSITKYLKDIDKAEKIYLKHAKYLTSSHGYVVKAPDTHPFDYMREKIKKRQLIINETVQKLNLNYKFQNLKELISKLLEMDLIFPKKKMKGFIREIYNFWEKWIILKHLEEGQYEFEKKN